jgi:hypothetical protein
MKTLLRSMDQTLKSSSTLFKWEPVEAAICALQQVVGASSFQALVAVRPAAAQPSAAGAADDAHCSRRVCDCDETLSAQHSTARHRHPDLVRGNELTSTCENLTLAARRDSRRLRLLLRREARAVKIATPDGAGDARKLCVCARDQGDSAPHTHANTDWLESDSRCTLREQSRCG